MRLDGHLSFAISKDRTYDGTSTYYECTFCGCVGTVYGTSTYIGFITLGTLGRHIHSHISASCSSYPSYLFLLYFPRARLSRIETSFHLVAPKYEVGQEYHDFRELYSTKEFAGWQVTAALCYTFRLYGRIIR